MFTEQEFTVHARAHMDTVFRVAFNILKSRTEADDVTQNVLFKLYRTDKWFESDAHIKNWLIRVTINECKRALLSPWRQVQPIGEIAESLSFETPEQSELFHMVMALPTKYRVTILLYYYEDYSVEEIARLTGVPKATAATRLRRAREKLKTNLLEAESYV